MQETCGNVTTSKLKMRGPLKFGIFIFLLFEFAANFAEGDFFELVAVSGLSSFFDRSRIFDDLSENEEI